MTDSFVFYKSFYDAIKMLPSVEEKWQAISSLMELGFYNVEADLEDASQMVQVIYILGEKQIKASVQHKIDGSKGGRPKKNNYGYSNHNNLVKNPPFEKIETNENVNVNVNVNENVNEKLNSLSLSPMQKNYSKLVFDIFKNNGLPCCNGNELSFMQRDFYNGRGYIQRQDDLKALHTDDVLQACRNYGEVFNDPNCYYKKKMDFYSFVQSKQFWNFLPSNFDKSAWLKFEIKAEQPKDENAERSAICPKCKTKHYYWSNDLQIFKCSNCGLTETFEENEARGD